MITILLKSDDNVLVKTDDVIRVPGPEGSRAVVLCFPTATRIKRPNLCRCSSCDIACDCPEEAECYHHADGIGGLCISIQGVTRVAVIDQGAYLADFGCGCSALPTEPEYADFPFCEHAVEYLYDEWKTYQPGPPRQAGTQAAKREQREARRGMRELRRLEQGIGAESFGQAMAAKMIRETREQIDEIEAGKEAADDAR